MKKENHAHWILQEIAEERSPGNTINLWPRIEARLAAQPVKSAPGIMRRVLKGELTMKRTVLFAAILLAILAVAAMAAIPTVRAQVLDWVSGQTTLFSFTTPHSKSSVGLFSDGSLGFVPVSPSHLPGGDWVTVPDSYKDEATGVETLKLTINKEDQFVILTERKALPGEPLPVGNAAKVNDQPAVLVTGLSGDAEASIPLDKDGGVEPEPSGLIRLKPISYTEGVRLTWQVGQIRLEMLSNLPLKQVSKIAASLQPVETSPAEIITTQP